LSTRQIRQLTDVFGTINADLLWSPDGRQLTLTGALDRTLDRPGGVYTVDVDDGEFRQISHETFNHRVPTWSPDSRQIAFVGTTSRSRQYVFIVNADGHNLRRLSRVDNIFPQPGWSPDGQHLVIAERLGGIHVLTISENGAGNDVVIGTGIIPAWSPQGDEIAFMSPSAGLWSSDEFGSIHIVNPDGSAPRRLSNFSPDWATALTWSPDGRHLAFVSYCDENAVCIFVMDAASGRVWRAVRYNQWCRPQECHIAWRPM
jgi:Tol biopolymer transport system component